MLSDEHSHPRSLIARNPGYEVPAGWSLGGLYPAGILPVVFVYGVLVAATHERCSQTKNDNGDDDCIERHRSCAFAERLCPG